MANNFNREKIFNKTNGHCSYCGCELNFFDFQVDHIVPKKKGGSNRFQNLTPACSDCNKFKFDCDLEEFRENVKNVIYTTFHGRIVGKYYKLKEQDIIFYFEQGDNNGSI